MPKRLCAYEDANTAARVARQLREAGLPRERVRLHLSKSHTEHSRLMAFDEQATGGLTTNLLSLFDDIFEWGSLPIDTSSYAATVRRGGAVVEIDTDSADEQALATRALAGAPAADIESGWIGRDAKEHASLKPPTDAPDAARIDDPSPLQTLGSAVSAPITGTAEQDDREQTSKRGG